MNTFIIMAIVLVIIGIVCMALDCKREKEGEDFKPFDIKNFSIKDTLKSWRK